MTRVWHLVRADARRFGLLLAVWVLIEAAATIFRGVRPALVADARMVSALELLGTVLQFARWLGMLLLVALVVQTHPLVGSDAFWMTRPIRWRHLLASKLAVLATTFVIVPVLCEAALMLVSGVPASDIPPIALQAALFQCWWLFLFMALSGATRNLARLALVAGGVLVGLALLLNIFIAVMMRNMPDGPQMVDVTGRSGTSPSGGVALLLLAITAGGAHVAVQYRTRSIKAAAAASVTGIALIVLVALYWPWPAPLLPPPAWAARDSAVRLISAAPRGEFTPSDWNMASAWQSGVTPMRVDGVEDGWQATVKLADASVEFPDGTTLKTAGNGYATTVRLAAAPETPVDDPARNVLGVARMLEAPLEPLSDRSALAIVISQSDFDKYRNATGTYRGRFVVDLDHLVTAATLPLHAGAVFQGRRHRVLIDEVRRQGRGLLVRIRLFSSASLFDTEQMPYLTFYLRNRSTSEAVSGSPHEQSGGHLGSPVTLATHVSFSAGPGVGFSITGQTLRFPTRYRPNEQGIELTGDWLSQAELVIVHTIASGSVTRTIETTGFQIVEAPPSVFVRDSAR
jgi:hypothetical protein